MNVTEIYAQMFSQLPSELMKQGFYDSMRNNMNLSYEHTGFGERVAIQNFDEKGFAREIAEKNPKKLSKNKFMRYATNARIKLFDEKKKEFKEIGKTKFEFEGAVEDNSSVGGMVNEDGFTVDIATNGDLFDKYPNATYDDVRYAQTLLGHRVTSDLEEVDFVRAVKMAERVSKIQDILNEMV